MHIVHFSDTRLKYSGYGKFDSTAGINPQELENFWRIAENKFGDCEKRGMELFGYWFLIQQQEEKTNVS